MEQCVCSWEMDEANGLLLLSDPTACPQCLAAMAALSPNKDAFYKLVNAPGTEGMGEQEAKDFFIRDFPTLESNLMRRWMALEKEMNRMAVLKAVVSRFKEEVYGMDPIDLIRNDIGACYTYYPKRIGGTWEN